MLLDQLLIVLPNRCNKTPLKAKHLTSREDDYVHEGAGDQNVPHYAVVKKPQNGKEVQKEYTDIR